MDASAVMNLMNPSGSDAVPGASVGGAPVDASATATPQPVSSGKPGLLEQWNNFLKMPGATAAVIQTGINLMQPIGVGQSVIGHIGQSIGAGAEAMQRAQMAPIEQDLRRSQADYYSGRSQYYAAGGGRTNGLTPGQILSQDERTKAAYSKVFMQALLSIDPSGLDPMGALRQLQQDPVKYQEFLKGVNEMFQQTQNAPGLSGAVGAAPKVPSAQSIAYAKKHPELKAQFEQTYGPGSWKQYIGT